jgi:ribonucleoside-diphosphate reductase alpha chain
MVNGMSTIHLDELTAEQCVSMSTFHPDYNLLASRIVISNHQKQTRVRTFSENVALLHRHQHPDIQDKSCPLLNDAFVTFVAEHGHELTLDYQRDFLLDHFGFKTLCNKYLLPGECPQDLWMRVAIAIHMPDLAAIQETYQLMSTLHFTHATPTLFNAGSVFQQFSSCFLVAMKEDSIHGIFDTLKDCAVISKYAGGIGMHIHNVRAKNSYIAGTNGSSNGIVPMLSVFNRTAKYVDQGGGKRKGSIAVFLEPWHLDIEEFIALRKNHGDGEKNQCRDLFLGLWIPDLFMKRVKQDESWTLMCPAHCPGLSEVHSDSFVALYERYEQEGSGKKTIKARELWIQILNAQMETGVPYICFKDAVNRKSNQQNLGTIQSSNLCVEINQYSSPTETAVCNLASISLPAMVRADGTFDFALLGNITRVLVRNLNHIIDRNFYPIEGASVSNVRHRPMGIGIQGLADVFFKMDVAFESDPAREVNRAILETMYYHAVHESMLLAKKHGHPYESYAGSPMSMGKFQFDLWGVSPSMRYPWNELREEVATYGVYNSLLLAPMPTASTSQILGNTECFEPVLSNVFTRQTLSGTFMMVNKYMVHELIAMKEWNEQTRQSIILHDGSVQQLTQLPLSFRNKYKTAWEMSMRTLIDMAAERGPYICQSQSLNLFVQAPKHNTLNAMLFHAWSVGLKTGCYYLRTRGKSTAQKFTVPIGDPLAVTAAAVSTPTSPGVAHSLVANKSMKATMDAPKLLAESFIQESMESNYEDKQDVYIEVVAMKAAYKEWLTKTHAALVKPAQYQRFLTQLMLAMRLQYDLQEERFMNVQWKTVNKEDTHSTEVCESCSA